MRAPRAGTRRTRMPRARTTIATATRNRSRRVRPARRRHPTTTSSTRPGRRRRTTSPTGTRRRRHPTTTSSTTTTAGSPRRRPPPPPAAPPPPAQPPPPAAADEEPPAAPPAPAACFNDAGETPALCSNLCSNPAGALAALRNPCASLGNFTPCNAFPNPPGKPCDANRSTCSNAIPSAAIAITTPAKLDRDSRNSIVCIAFPEPPNSAANPGNPDATHAPDGSRRNSARNSGSTNNRSINRPARSSWVSLDDTVHLAGAVAGALQKRGSERDRDREQQHHEEQDEAPDHHALRDYLDQDVMVMHR